jgi:hypothetical protein
LNRFCAAKQCLSIQRTLIKSSHLSFPSRVFVEIGFCFAHACMHARLQAVLRVDLLSPVRDVSAREMKPGSRHLTVLPQSHSENLE